MEMIVVLPPLIGITQKRAKKLELTSIKPEFFSLRYLKCVRRSALEKVRERFYSTVVAIN